MVFEKMAAIFGGGQPFQMDHLQPNLFLTIQNPDLSGFQIPTV